MSIKRRDNDSGYEVPAIGGIKSKVVIGGHSVDTELGADEFEPSIHSVFHDGDAHLSIHHIDSGKTGRTDTLTGDVVRHSTNGFEHEFYESANNTLKWDMIFDAPPVTPNLLFRIKHSPNLAFYKQELSAQDIADGSEYVVPEVEGSYAVYYKDGRTDGRWQTGKVCHIYSPYFIDGAGVRSPICETELVQVEPGVKRLVVKMPTLWLNAPARVYPCRLDPSLGYDTVGGSSGSISNWVWHTIATQSDATGGAIKGLHVAIAAANGGVKMSVANCAQVSPFDPEGLTLIAQGVGTAEISDDYEMPSLTNYAPVLPNTYYRVGLTTENTDTHIKFDALAVYAPNRYVQDYANEIKNPVPVTEGLNVAARLSIWAEYAPTSIAVGGGLSSSDSLMFLASGGSSEL